MFAKNGNRSSVLKATFCLLGWFTGWFGNLTRILTMQTSNTGSSRNELHIGFRHVHSLSAGKGHGRLLPALIVFMSFGAIAGEFDRLNVKKLNNLNLPTPAEVKATPEELLAAKGMETLLLDTMIQEMRRSVPESDLVPTSQGEKIFRQLLDSEYARTISESQGLGIAELIVAQMKGKR